MTRIAIHPRTMFLALIAGLFLLPLFSYAAGCASPRDCSYPGSQVCETGTLRCVDGGSCDLSHGACDPKYNGQDSSTLVPTAQSSYGNGTIPLGQGGTFAEVVGSISDFVDGSVLPLMYILAFLFFVAGVARYFLLSDEEGKKQGKDFAIWGLIGIVVLFSTWSLVKLLLGVLTGGGV